MSSKILLPLFTWFYISTFFHSEQDFSYSRTYSFQWSLHVSNFILKFQTNWFESSTQSSLIIHNSCSIYYPVSFHSYCTSVMSQFSSLAVLYFIMGFKSFSPTFLVYMFANFRPLLHKPILCILKFSPIL